MMLRYLLILPRARRWLGRVIAEHEPGARPIDNFNFDRLHLVLSPNVLSRVKLAVVERVPQPPLRQWGITGGLADDAAAGIAFDQLICVRRGMEHDESLVFHELVHAVQWRALGRHSFLVLYGLMLVDHGYLEHPLEMMACELQARFAAGTLREDVTAAIERRTLELCDSYRRRSLMHRVVFASTRLRTHGCW